MTGCCNYAGRCVTCVMSGQYWFTLNNTRSVLTCCCREPHNQPGTIVDWAEYPSQCSKDEHEDLGVVIGWTVAVFVMLFVMVIAVYIFKKGIVQRYFHRRGNGQDDIPLVRYERNDGIYLYDLSLDD